MSERWIAKKRNSFYIECLSFVIFKMIILHFSFSDLRKKISWIWSV